MAKAKSLFICAECGTTTSKWQGQCPGCGAWNSLSEEAAVKTRSKSLAGRKGVALPFVGLEGAEADVPRRVSGIAEFDRVTGGGLVPGSAVLIGGDPGIGKSTILLQVTCALASAGRRIAYVSGEEAVDQVRMRARRLGLDKAPVNLASSTDVRGILAAMESDTPPEVIVIDSIQTMYVDLIDSAPGTVSQVRASAQELIRVAKKQGTCLIMIGHVTKDGQIAGPRVLEHMVDTVLYFEGDRGHQFRILRAVKNRFGPTDEIGVFAMTDKGLSEVANPSALFLAERQGQVAGAAVVAGMEGTRPVLVEIQALVAPSPLGTPRRAVVGWDSGRLAMVLAVLEARCGLPIGANDVYLNIAGGLKLAEPAADLGVAAALASSLSGTALPADLVLMGEIGLAGEIRPVAHIETRLKEAAKLGFEQAWIPARRDGIPKVDGLNINSFEHLSDLLAQLAQMAQAEDS
ncbi:MAG: DNA repair protein RadA [Alphaproteobacteria bacterium]